MAATVTFLSLQCQCRESFPPYILLCCSCALGEQKGTQPSTGLNRMSRFSAPRVTRHLNQLVPLRSISCFIIWRMCVIVGYVALKSEKYSKAKWTKRAPSMQNGKMSGWTPAPSLSLSASAERMILNHESFPRATNIRRIVKNRFMCRTLRVQGKYPFWLAVRCSMARYWEKSVRMC